MTCPNFSRKDGKYFCRDIGFFEPTEEKIGECFTQYQTCLNTINERRNKSKSDLIEEQFILRGLFFDDSIIENYLPLDANTVEF